MAQYVWRYAPTDPTTAHLVYTDAGSGKAGVASISACATAEVPTSNRWRATSAAPKPTTCRACVARFPHATTP